MKHAAFKHPPGRKSTNPHDGLASLSMPEVANLRGCGRVGCFFGPNLVAAAVLLLAVPAAADEFILIGDDLSISTINLRSIDAERVRGEEYRSGRTVDRAIGSVLALLREDVSVVAPRGSGWLTLADGQRFPGRWAEHSTVRPQTASWEHPSFGLLAVKLDDIDSILIDTSIALPEPADSDLVLLTNGDRIEGYVVDLGDHVTIEIDRDGRTELISIDSANIAAVNMISPRRAPGQKRLWLRDGTVVEVSELFWTEGDRAEAAATTRWESAAHELVIRANRIVAVSLDASRLVPLADLAPHRVEGPAYRYHVPQPLALDEQALLGLSSLDLRGPITVQYALPSGAARFAAEVMVPPAAQHWIDTELIVRLGSAEVYRQHLHEGQTQASISLPITGRELTIELTDGRHGSIHNHVRLVRPRLLIAPR